MDRQFDLAARCLIATLLVAGLTSVFGLTSSVDAQPAAVAEKAAIKKEVVFDPAEWKELVDKKAALLDKLKELGKQAEDAKNDERQKIATEAVGLQKEFQEKMSPRMGELAPAAYKANAKDVDAAEIVLQIEYGNMRFRNAANVADQILAIDPEHELSLNLGGVANYATNSFEKAVRLLEAAKKSGNIFKNLGSNYYDSAQTYVSYWEKESRIRQQEATAKGDAQLPRVKMTTSKGDIVIELFENEAPNTVANFVSLIEKGFYDGLAFHRVMPSFMAQGGCPNSKEGSTRKPGSGGPGYNIKCEAYAPDARRHFGGTLSMAHAGKDTGGSQFFITHLPTPHLDQEVSPRSVHTVFGRVIEGMDVVWAIRPNDGIKKVEVIRKRDHEYKPETQAASR